MHTGDKTPVVCCLGRYGDIINALPIAYEIYRTQGIKPKFVVSREFWTILEGVTYVQPIVWDLPYSDLPRAITRLEGKHEIICQSYKHTDDRHLTDSYQTEAWRLAGWLDKFGKLPLVFDNRNKQREDKLFKQIFGNETKPIILFCGKSVSSPIDYALILDGIVKTFSDSHHILNMSETKAERIYDLIGLMDRAHVLVTVDTSPLHLARASNVKMVALVNDGWFGSKAKEGSIVIPYATVKQNPVLVAMAVQSIVENENTT